jgi:hypothetical protein
MEAEGYGAYLDLSSALYLASRVNMVNWHLLRRATSSSFMASRVSLTIGSALEDENLCEAIA